MKKLYIFISLLFTFTANAQKQVPVWGTQFGGGGWDVVNGISVDQKDNVYITGSFTDTIFNSEGSYVSYGGRDIFVAKTASDGKLKWFNTIGGNGFDNGIDILSDKAGSTFISALIEDTVNCFGQTIAGKGRSILLACVNATGSFKWAKIIEGTQFTLNGLALCGSEELCIGGSFRDTLRADGKVLTTTGDYDAYIFRFDKQGKITAMNRYGTSTDDRLLTMAADSSGNMVIGGHTYIKNTVNGNPASPAIKKQMFVQKIDRNNNTTWTHRFIGSAWQIPSRLAIAADGSVYFAGVFYETMEVGDSQFSCKGLEDIFLIKYAPGGGLMWDKQIGSPSRDMVGALITTSTGDVVITGNFHTILNIDSLQFSSVTEKDNIFLVKFTPAGVLKTAQQFGTNETEYCKEIVADSKNNLYIAGSFDSFTWINEKSLVSHGKRDVFVSRLIDCENRMFVFSDSIILCENEGEIKIPKGFEDRYYNKQITQNHLKAAGKEHLDVKVTDSLGCEVTDTIFIQRSPVPEIDLGADTTITNKDQLVLDGGAGFERYTWSDGSDNRKLVIHGQKQLPGSYLYSLEVENKYGCTNRDSVIVKIISEIEQQTSGVNVYPNPAKEIFYWSLLLPEPENLIVTLDDLSGKRLYFEKIKNYTSGNVVQVSARKFKGVAILNLKGKTVDKSVKVIFE